MNIGNHQECGSLGVVYVHSRKGIMNQFDRKIFKLSLLFASTFLACIFAGYLLIGPTTWTSEPRDLRPSYEELDRRGYYAYVMPPSIVEQNGWREEIFIWSWSRHCNVSPGTTNNPLRITYIDEQDDPIFRTELSPWGLIEWKPFQPTVKIPFDTQWAEPGTLEMFEGEKQNKKEKTLYLRYKDWYGTPIYIVSKLSLTETLTLLHVLNYEGAPQEEAAPWRC